MSLSVEQTMVDRSAQRADDGSGGALSGGKRRPGGQSAPTFVKLAPPTSTRDVQSRINRALHETQGEQAATAGRSSDYLPDRDALDRRLMSAAGSGGLVGIKAVLAEFERLTPVYERSRLQRALRIVLTHLPDVAAQKLRLPSMMESSPGRVLPSHAEPA